MLARCRSLVGRLLYEEAGQTSVEYMLGVSVVAIGITVAFIYMSDSTRKIFDNARRMIELPYP